ncbi:MAG: flagellar export protein FliJ [Alphaproteobacteria bacterium]|nr:flagellar export protein FliJ [Alphaproteobacteria bacterium]MBM3733865.1 flagellar export protein FliJ [Acidimicrobiia bacterium]
MAKNLKGLIRLHKWMVDEKRRKLGDLLKMLAELEEQLRQLEAEVVAEQKAAANAPETAGFLYGNYARRVIERRERLVQSIASMEMQISAAREELNDAYRELKKFQVVQDVRDRREALEAARREQGVLDEIGLTIHR